MTTTITTEAQIARLAYARMFNEALSVVRRGTREDLDALRFEMLYSVIAEYMYLADDTDLCVEFLGLENKLRYLYTVTRQGKHCLSRRQMLIKVRETIAQRR